MENKINLAELLKDCPKGVELDCTLFDNVILSKIDYDESNDYPIRVETSNGYLLDLTKYGTYTDVPEAKCVIFLKGKTTWEGFVPPCRFKDGDVVISTFNNIHLISCRDKNNGWESCCSIIYGEFDSTKTAHIIPARLATKEEKRKLFQAIEENGYKWNAETKTLEKLITPEFKVGNSIREKDDNSATFTISDIDDSCYYCGDYVICNICDQDNWELVPNRFDITTLKAFDSRVLVRMDNYDLWRPAFFWICR